jgi:tetratricopeptide (TPR) repeat protein
LCDRTGRPVFGGLQAVALSYTGGSAMRPENLDKALAGCAEELRIHPDNTSARTLTYSIRLKQSGASAAVKRLIEIEVDSLLSAPGDRLSALRFALGAYRMLGLDDKARMIENSLVAQDPAGEEAALKRFSEILKIEDPVEKTGRLGAFVNDFPDSRIAETAMAQLAGSAIESNNTDALLRAGDMLLKKASTPAGADALAAVAGVLADGRLDLDRAETYVEKALGLVDSGFAGSATEGTDDAVSIRARILDVSGWLAFQRGDASLALSTLREAEKHTLQANVLFHLGVVLEQTGRIDEALTEYARAAAFKGGAADAALDAFRTAWRMSGKDTLLAGAFLNEQARWAEEAGRSKILSKADARPAPDFRLEDSEGGWVKLSEQLGVPVVLCFWGSWSKSSASLLQSLGPVAEVYGDRVLVLTVAMDRQRLAVRNAIRKWKIALPVLFNDGLERDYGIEGVPMVFVVDSKGRILFTHRGFRADITQILGVELDDLLREGSG